MANQKNGTSLKGLLEGIKSFDDLKSIESMPAVQGMKASMRNHFLREATRHFVENCPFA